MAIARKVASEEDIKGVTQEKMPQYRQWIQKEIDNNALESNFPWYLKYDNHQFLDFSIIEWAKDQVIVPILDLAVDQVNVQDDN